MEVSYISEVTYISFAELHSIAEAKFGDNV